MAKNGFKVLDSDMHVIEPKDLWQRYIDPKFGDRAPQCYDRYLGDMQILVEGVLQPVEPPEVSEAVVQARGFNQIYQDPFDNGWDSASQFRAMNKEGIDVCVLYPSRGLFALAQDSLDAGLGAAIASAYNDWMHDFCGYNPERMLGAALLSPFDAESAARETSRAVNKLGFKAAFIRPNIVNNRNWHDPYYNPLWSTLEELEVPLGFHEGSNAAMNQVGKRFDPNNVMYHTACHPMEMMLATIDLVGGGVLERFPGLQVAFLEANCSWVPWLLWRLDEHQEWTGDYEAVTLSSRPSEYFLRQCYASIEADETPASFLEQTGFINNVVFSTDYPHPDSRYPHAIDTFLEMPLSEESKRKVLWDNCARLYNMN